MWNNTIYQPMDNSIVYALDARTGQQKWMYDAKIDPGTRSHMCCGTHNRGLAISEGKIILAANDARLIALDAISGKELWQTKVADINQYYSLTIAPRIAGDKVVIGVAGGEYFIRGFFAAFNLKDEDVHRRTAGEIFGVPASEVSDRQRGIAKAVNFGLMYGKTAFGLAQEVE